MKRITIPNYLPTLTKGVHSDIEVTYSDDRDDDGVVRIAVDEVFCNDVNLTALLTQTAFNDLASEVKRLLDYEKIAAEVAINWE